MNRLYSSPSATSMLSAGSGGGRNAGGERDGGGSGRDGNTGAGNYVIDGSDNCGSRGVRAGPEAGRDLALNGGGSALNEGGPASEGAGIDSFFRMASTNVNEAESTELSLINSDRNRLIDFFPKWANIRQNSQLFYIVLQILTLP